MKTRLFLLWLAGLLAACTPTGPSNSSSSHWLMCEEFSDCAAVAAAAACTDGYCVDANGNRIAVPRPGSDTDADASAGEVLDAASPDGATSTVDGSTSRDDAEVPPAVLRADWHTFYGSDYGEDVTSVAVGTDDSIYIAGIAQDTWNGPNGEPPLAAIGLRERDDIFVMKLSAEGAYQWHTFLGASLGTDYPHALTVGADGNLYLTGLSNAAWNGPSGEEPLNAFTGGSEIVVLSLRADGEFRWHTFLGRASVNDSFSGHEYVGPLAVDQDNNLYLCGRAAAHFDGPKGAAPLRDVSPSSAGFPFETFVVKVASNGAYLWHTFLGGSGADACTGLDVDAQGHVYITGTSTTAWTADQGRPLRPRISSEDEDLTDVYVAKLTPSGVLEWHTFFGSSTNDSSSRLRVGPDGALYVSATSGEFWQGPNGREPLDLHRAGSFNPLTLIKLTNAGDFVWHAFFASSPFYVFDIAFEHERVVAVGVCDYEFSGPAGEKPLMPHAVASETQYGSSSMIVSLNLDGRYAWHSFSGPTDTVWLNAVASDSRGQLVLGGSSMYRTWNVGDRTPLHAKPTATPGSVGHDALVMKLSPP